ncbi:MAG TPA: hypothetical protein VEW71_03985 [Allosphingosinicella sp.]|nr:hypothetical protein [Allosphingosinicella sp.]
MNGRAIVTAAVALLVLLAGILFLALRERPSGDADEQASSTPPAAQAPRAPPPAPQPVDLGSALELGRLADCSQSPALASVLEQMVRIDPTTFESRRGGPISVPGYDRPLVPTFERTREIDGNSDIRAVTADLDLPGRWHGLAVTGLRRSFYEESDASAFDVRFAEPPERVRETLVRQGFRLPPVGEFREVNLEPGISTEIGVGRIDGGAALTCATG